MNLAQCPDWPSQKIYQIIFYDTMKTVWYSLGLVAEKHVEYSDPDPTLQETVFRELKVILSTNPSANKSFE